MRRDMVREKRGMVMNQGVPVTVWRVVRVVWERETVASMRG